jgi:protein-S-isoprenylcysteine O-methyltransferase Ste14
MEAANTGAIRPPLIYLAAIGIGWLLELVLPAPFIPGAVAVPLGLLLAALGVALFFFSVGKFHAAGTPVPGNKPTVAIVRSGPYRFSRNPIYLAFSLLQLGLAIGLNSLWLIATLIPAHAVMAWIVVPREELYLERTFGAEYLAYKNSVRRWI